MTANVVKFYPSNAAVKADNVLEQAAGVYDTVFIIGYDAEGDLEIRASTNHSCKDILWMLEVFKHKLLAGDYATEATEQDHADTDT